jgi:hypothetical protein
MPGQILSALSASRRARGIASTPVGQTFARLTVIACEGYLKRGNDPRARLYWRCRCDCGTERPFAAQSVKNGDARSCGCLVADRNVELLTGKPSRARKPFGEANRNMVLLFYRNRAGRLGRTFSIARDDFFRLTASNCFYCGAPPSNRMSWKGCYGTYVYSGIDRVDNALGYEPGNCVPCCGACNRAKGAMSSADFVALARAIAERHPVRVGRERRAQPGRAGN